MYKRQLLYSLIFSLVLFVTIFLLSLLMAEPSKSEPTNYSYRILNVYPHNKTAFTQGLLFERGLLYESTGLYGSSSLRCIDLETGAILRFQALQAQFFGEGIAISGERIIQLTWREKKGFVYDKNSFELIQEFSYSTEGWGITYDGLQLIMSDGTSTLYFLNSSDFQRTGQVEVYDDNGPVYKLNELEYIQGMIYANIWLEERIAIIDPQSGYVEAWINLAGIQNMENTGPNDVLNGIAYDNENNRIFVTGKRWPQLFEIELIPEE